MSDGSAGVRRRLDDSALQLGPRKRPSVLGLCQYCVTYRNFLPRCTADPLIHHGRHFGRTVHALCNVQALLTNGLLRIGELAGEPDESFTNE